MAVLSAQAKKERELLEAILDEHWGKTLEAGYRQALAYNEEKSIYLKCLILGGGVAYGLSDVEMEKGQTPKSVDRLKTSFKQLSVVIPKFRECLESVAAKMFRANPVLPKPLLKMRASMIDLECLVNGCFTITDRRTGASDGADRLANVAIERWKERVFEFRDLWQWKWTDLEPILEIGWRSEAPSAEPQTSPKRTSTRSGPRQKTVGRWISELIDEEGVDRVAELSASDLAKELERLHGALPSLSTIKRTEAWMERIMPIKDRLGQ